MRTGTPLCLQALGRRRLTIKVCGFSSVKRTGLIFPQNTDISQSNLGGDCCFITRGDESFSRLFFIFVKPAQGLEIISNVGRADTFGHVTADPDSCPTLSGLVGWLKLPSGSDSIL